jgi:hypothetical protein
MSLIVRINAWPGSGKLTIARILAERIAARLLDNHTMMNPSEALFDRGDRRHVEMRLDLRDVILRYAVGLSPETNLIFTDAISTDAWDVALFDHYRELARLRNARLVTIVLDIDPEENARRVVTPERALHRKTTSVEMLAMLRRQFTLLRPDDAICLDVTKLSAEAAADQLASAMGFRPVQPAERVD